MKKLLLLSFITLLLYVPLNSQIKRVLLEQHTGAWCGWCVDGTVVMDSLILLYPDQVIGVKIHNGDSMAIPEEDIIAAAIGLTSFPSGTVDRASFGGTIPQARNLWKSDCETRLDQTPKVDVNVIYNINTQTRQLMVKVYANMLKTLYDPLRFNVIIMEDSVSGKGTGWDQSNYLSNRKGYELNPYFNLPSKLEGYQHMKVARVYLGGAWGVQGSFTQPASQGQVFSQEFNYTLPDNWKIKDIKVVGLVQIEAPAVKEVLNCAYGVKGEAKLQLTSTGNNKDVIAPNNAFQKDYKLQNITSSVQTYIVAVNKSGRTPIGWKVEVSGVDANNEVTLNPNEEKNISLSLTPNDVIGIGDASIKVIVKNDNEAFSGNGTITAYSSKINNIEVINAGESAYSLSPILNLIGFDNFYQLSSSDYNEMSPKFTKKTLVWNSGVTEYPAPEDVSSILAALQEKVPVFLCGNQMTSALGNNNALQLFGANYNGYSTQGYGNAPWRVWLAGVSGEPIAGPYGKTIEGNLIKYLITLLKITNTDITTPFMTFANDGKRVVYNGQTGTRDTFDVTGPDAVLGIKVDNGTQRFALWSIVPHVIVNGQIRTNIYANIIRWINYVQTGVDSEPIVAEVSPIPAKDIVVFRYPDANFDKLKIYNLMGVLLDETSLDGTASFNYNASGLGSGTYYAVFSKADKKAITQFSIVK